MKYKICGWTMFHCWIYHSLSIAPKENFEKILKKFHKNSKKSKSFFSNSEKVWNSLKHDEYFIHFRLVGLRLDPQKIRKVQFFKKKCYHIFERSKLTQKNCILVFFCPRIFEKLQKKSKFQSEISIRKTKILKKLFWHFRIF